MRLMTHPRPYNTDIGTHTVIVQAQSLFDDRARFIKQDDAQFLEGKYVCFAPTHHSAVVMGSTIQNINPTTRRYVFDASKIVYRLNQNGVRTGIEMALASGLQAENSSWSNYAVRNTCDTLISDTHLGARLPDDLTTMANIAMSTVNTSDKVKSTLTAVKLSNNDKENIKAACINVGDNVLLVLDGTSGSVKSIIHPTKYEIIKGEQVPIYLQSLVNKSNPLLYIDRKEFLLQPNDIVILGSAGFVDTLAGAQKTYHIAIDQTVTVAGDEKSKLESRNEITYIKKEIDIEKLNSRLKIIFDNLRQDYPLQPPAFAIADALIKDAAHITLTDRQEKQAFVQWMHDMCQDYKEANCSAELKQYEERKKRIREMCANQCINIDYVKLKDTIYNFRRIFFESTDEQQKNALWEQFVQVITQKIMQATSQDYNQKDKERVIEERESIKIIEKDFTPEQLYRFIIDTLKSILLQSNNLQPDDVDHMIDLVSGIFHDEIIKYARKLSNKSISAADIAKYSHKFRSKLADSKLNSPNGETLEKFLSEFKISWSQHLELWLKGERTGLLSDRLKANLEKRQDWFLLRCIQYLDYKHKKQIQELPKLKDTIAQFISWCENSISSNQEYLLKLKNYLITNNIDPNTPLHQLEQYCSPLILKYGDDTTVSVAYVLDPALEIMRAMVPYCRTDAAVHSSGMYSFYKEKREMYWKKLCTCYPENKVTFEIVKQLIAKLRAEKQVGRADIPAETCSTGQKLEDLKSHTVSSYIEDEILNLEQFCLLKTNLQAQVTRINQVTTDVADKSSAHMKLKEILINPNLSALKMCGLYNELAKEQFVKLNQHRNSVIDYWLGITITKSWSLNLKTIRNDCLTKLMREVDTLLNNNEAASHGDQCIKALALLQNAVNQPLFYTHRNNSIFTGAYGDTHAVKVIRQRIISITDQLTALQKSQGVGIELKPI